MSAGRLVGDKLARAAVSLEELWLPASSVLVVVDMQNDFVHEEGFFARHGADVSSAGALVPTIVALVESARRAAVGVVWLQYAAQAGHASDSAAYPLRRMSRLLAYPPAQGGSEFGVRGTWGWDFADGLKPAADDVLVEKPRSSGFLGTSLDIILRSNGVQNTVVCGEATSGCVLFTAMDSLQLGYFTTVVSDGVADFSADQHAAGMKVLEARVDLASSTQLRSFWDACADG